MNIWYVHSRNVFFINSLHQGAIGYYEIWAVVIPRIRPRHVPLQLENWG